MGPGYRTFAGMMICLFFAVALMILSLLAYIFNSWFTLALVTSVPFASLFSYWFFVPESPRWLLSYGYIDEAEVIVQGRGFQCVRSTYQAYMLLIPTRS